MRVVIDTNVLVAGLLKDSTVRSILVRASADFFTPAYVLREYRKHWRSFLRKSGMREDELSRLLAALLSRITLVEDAAIVPWLKQARRAMQQLDVDDAPLLACALSVRADGIWTFDKHFLQQSLVQVFSTQDMMNSVKKI